MQDTEIFLSMKKEIEAESQKEIDAIIAESCSAMLMQKKKSVSLLLFQS